MVYRKADSSDIDKIIELRIKLLIEEAAVAPNDINAELREYFTKELNKNIIVMLAESGGEVVGTSAVIFQKYPPHFGNKKGMRAYITNVYTEREFRRKGISTALLNELIKEIKQRDIPHVWLWSTKEGVEFYEKYGFNDIKMFNTMEYLP